MVSNAHPKTTFCELVDQKELPPDFVRAIDHGRNGLLADTAEEWQEALGALIESPASRREIGALAREDVQEKHTTAARAPLLGRTMAALGVPVAGQ